MARRRNGYSKSKSKRKLVKTQLLDASQTLEPRSNRKGPRSKKKARLDTDLPTPVRQDSSSSNDPPMSQDYQDLEEKDIKLYFALCDEHKRIKGVYPPLTTSLEELPKLIQTWRTEYIRKIYNEANNIKVNEHADENSSNPSQERDLNHNNNDKSSGDNVNNSNNTNTTTPPTGPLNAFAYLLLKRDLTRAQEKLDDLTEQITSTMDDFNKRLLQMSADFGIHSAATMSTASEFNQSITHQLNDDNYRNQNTDDNNHYNGELHVIHLI